MNVIAQNKFLVCWDKCTSFCKNGINGQWEDCSESMLALTKMLRHFFPFFGDKWVKVLRGTRHHHKKKILIKKKSTRFNKYINLLDPIKITLWILTNKKSFVKDHGELPQGKLLLFFPSYFLGPESVNGNYFGESLRTNGAFFPERHFILAHWKAFFIN